jgi:hypothetical protein
MNISLLDLHWLAGFLEGEGSFTRQRRKTNCGQESGSISVSVSQVQREPLERCQKMCGVGKIKGEYRNNPNHSNYYRWTLHGENAAELMKLVFGLMSPKRQNQISIALSWYASLPGKNYMKSGRKFCRQGTHPWSGDNIRFDHRGRTFCHACKMAWQQRKRSSVIQEAENLIKVI